MCGTSTNSIFGYPFNRTIVELKFVRRELLGGVVVAFNRTIVELKFGRRVYIGECHPVF